METNKERKFTKVEKVMAWGTDEDSAKIFSELRGKEDTWRAKGKLGIQILKGGERKAMFYTSYGDLNDETTLNFKRIAKAIKVLVSHNLITTKKGTKGESNYYAINKDEYDKWMDKYSELREHALEVKRLKRKLKEREDEGAFDYKSSKARGYLDTSIVTGLKSKLKQAGIPYSIQDTSNQPVQSRQNPRTTKTNNKTNNNTNIEDTSKLTGLDNNDEVKSTALKPDQTLGANGQSKDAVQEKPSVTLPATKKNKAEDIFKECIEGYDFTNEGWDKLYDNLKETMYVSDAEPKDRGYMKKVMDKLHKDGKLIERLTGNSNGSKQPLMNIMMDMSTTPW